MFAQGSKPARPIAVLFPSTQSVYRARLEAFRSELKKLGYMEGRDLLIEVRFAENSNERLHSLAAELVALRPAVILTATSAAILACKKATSTIPIVFATAVSPVEQGIVSSLRRPGGNITGVLVHLDVSGKMVEIAREALPQAQRLAVLVHESDPAHKLHLHQFMRAADRFKFEAVVVRANRAEELVLAFDEIVRQKADALYLPPLAFVLSHSGYLVERSLKARLPLLSGVEETTTIGGLLSYTTGREENFRRAAVLVDKILRGTKPGDLPVEQPERFQLIVNRKTAKAIGVNLSAATMLRADRVID